MRKVRNGKSSMHSRVRERQSDHYHSRQAFAARVAAASQRVWDDTLSPWARARLQAPSLTDGRTDGEDGET